jgi:hypothetical protein
MKRSRTLALNAEHLTELSYDDLSAVHGAAVPFTINDRCEEPRPPSDFFVSVCECLTRTCG